MSSKTDAAIGVAKAPSAVLADASSSEETPARYVSLMASMTPESLGSLGIRVRLEASGKDSMFGCTVLDFERPNYGSFNLLYTLQFSDGMKWVVRIPAPGEQGLFTPTSSRFIRSDAMTMSFIRQNTNIPIPEIFDFDETVDNEIGAPYMMMEFVEGKPVSELWFDDTGPTPLEERRLRILDTVAEAMSQMSKFRFDKIGSLQFGSDASKPTNIGPCNVLDETSELAAMLDGCEPAITFRKIGPFNTSREYFQALLNMQDDPSDPASVGIRELLNMMFQELPRSLPTKKLEAGSEIEIETETFVLAHPDFGPQNVIVSENGSLVALIDWDDVQTVPHCIGNTRYPSWITRDWDPLRYGYGNPHCGHENSPQELEYFRSYYADKMASLVSESLTFSRKTHVFEAFWIAVSSPTCSIHIIDKFFKYLFPEGLEKEPLFLYDTAIGLGENTHEEKWRICEGFRGLLAY